MDKGAQIRRVFLLSTAALVAIALWFVYAGQPVVAGMLAAIAAADVVMMFVVLRSL
jgi:hypothetical protein